MTLIHTNEYQDLWLAFLSTIKTQCTKKKPLNVFISYAWEANEAENAVLQGRLKMLAQHLLDAGADNAFLDVNQIDGDLKEAMLTNIHKSNVVIVIPTERYALRVTDKATRSLLKKENKLTNVAFEYEVILQARETRNIQVFPLWLQGSVASEVIPEELRDLPYYDARDAWQWAKTLGDWDTGLLPKVFALVSGTDAAKAYQDAWQQFENGIAIESAKRNIPATVPSLVSTLAPIPVNTPEDASSVSFNIYWHKKVLPTVLAPSVQSTKQKVFYLLHEGDVSPSFKQVVMQNFQNHSRPYLVIHLPLSQLSMQRKDFLTDYFMTQHSLQESDIAALKYAYRFIFILEGYDALGMHNVIADNELLSWAGIIVLSLQQKNAHYLDWLTYYVKEQGYDITSDVITDFPVLSVHNELTISQLVVSVQQDRHESQAALDFRKRTMTTTAGSHPEIAGHGRTLRDALSEQAFNQCWAEFLEQVRSLVQFPERLLICHEESIAEPLTGRLFSLQHALQACSANEVKLATLSEAYKNNFITTYEKILLICTPKFNKQLNPTEDQSGNVILTALLSRQSKDPNSLMPLQYDGSFYSAIPKAFHQILIRDCRDPWHSVYQLAAQVNPVGIIPALFNLKEGNPKGQEYHQLWERLQDEGYGSIQFLTPQLLIPLQKQRDNQRKMMEGQYVKQHYIWPDVSVNMEGDQRTGLQDYWQKIINKMKLEESANNQPVHYLLGSPGTGKSTAMFRLEDDLWDQLSSTHCLPIRIPLSQLPKGVTNYAKYWLEDICKYTSTEVELLRRHYRIVWILDGYDELLAMQDLNLLTEENFPLFKADCDQVLIGCRTQQKNKLAALDEVLINGGQKAGDVQYLREFNTPQIEEYIRQYFSEKFKRENKNETLDASEEALIKQKIERAHTIPGLWNLIQNPLLLQMVVSDLLLNWQEDTEQSHEAAKPMQQVTRYQLYDLFVSKYFRRSLIRQFTQGLLANIHGDDAKVYEEASVEFVEAITQTMYREQRTWMEKEELHKTAEAVLKTRFKKTDFTQHLSPLRKAGPFKGFAGRYEFIHRSFYEFILARQLTQVSKNPDAIRILLNKHPLQEEPEVMSFFAEAWQHHLNEEEKTLLRALLVQSIHLSKENINVSQSSANSATLLKYLKQELKDIDWSHARLLRADLSEAQLQGTNFSGAHLDYANLQGADFSGATLIGARLSNTILRDVNFNIADLGAAYFGEYPWVDTKYPMTAVVYHPIQPWVAVTKKDCILCYDHDSGLIIYELKGHVGQVATLAFSPDGKWLASAGADKTIKLWNVQTGKITHTFKGHTEWVNSVAFDHTSRWLASGSSDNTARLWNVVTGKLAGKSMKKHTDSVLSVAFNKSGDLLVTASRDHTCVLWSVLHQQPCAEIKTLSIVQSLAFSPTENYFVTGSEDATVQLWMITADTKSTLITAMGQSMKAHKAQVLSVAFHPNGRLVASSSRDYTCRLYDISTQHVIGQPLTGHDAYVMAIAFKHDGTVLASASLDGTCRFHDMEMALQQEHISRPLIGHAGLVNSIVLDSKAELILSGSQDKTARLWQASTHIPLGKPISMRDAITCVAFQPQGQFFVLADKTGHYRLYNIATQKPLGEAIKAHDSVIHALVFHPTSELLVTAGADKTCKIWDLSEPQNPILKGRMLKIETMESIQSIAFDPTGKFLALGGADYIARLWGFQLFDSGAIKLLRGHRGRINALAFHHTEQKKCLASGSEDKTCRLWDFSNLDKITQKELIGHTAEVTSLMFSPDDYWLISASADRTCRLWALQDPEKISSLILITLTAAIQAIFLAQHPGDAMLYRLVLGDSFGTVSLYSVTKNIIVHNEAPEQKPQLEAEMIGENVRLIVNGLKLNGTKLNSSNRRLLDLYGADTRAVEKVDTTIPRTSTFLNAGMWKPVLPAPVAGNTEAPMPSLSSLQIFL